MPDSAQRMFWTISDVVRGVVEIMIAETDIEIRTIAHRVNSLGSSIRFELVGGRLIHLLDAAWPACRHGVYSCVLGRTVGLTQMNMEIVWYTVIE